MRISRLADSKISKLSFLETGSVSGNPQLKEKLCIALT